jgi:hypothetical protein
MPSGGRCSRSRVRCRCGRRQRSQGAGGVDAGAGDGGEEEDVEGNEGSNEIAGVREEARVIGDPEDREHEERGHEKLGEEGGGWATETGDGDGVVDRRRGDARADEEGGEADAEEAAGEVAEDVEVGVDGVDLTEAEIGQGDGGVEVGAGAFADIGADDEHGGGAHG